MFWPALAAALWGGMYVVSRLAFADVPPVTLGLVRLLVALPALLLALRRLPNLRDRRLAMLGVLLAATLIMQFAGTDLSGAAAGSVLTLATPIFVAVLAPVVLREPASFSGWLGIGIALVGAVLVSGPAGTGSWTGNALLLASAATWAIFTVLGAPLVRTQGALAVTTGATSWALPLMTVAAAAELAGGAGVHPGWASLAASLYLGLGATALAWWAWYRGMVRLPAAKSAVLFLLQPVVGVGLSIPIFGTRPTAGFAVGAVLVMAGTLLATRP